MTATDEESPKRQSIGARRNPATAEAIRAAAIAVLTEDGPAGFSIEAVARRARAGKPTIYRWWPSKAALLLDAYQTLKRDIVYPDTGDLEKDLLLFLKSLFAHWRDTPGGGIFRFMLAEAQVESSAHEAFVKYITGRRQRVAEMVGQPRAKGGLTPGVNPDTVAGLVLSFAWMCLLTDRLDDADAGIEASIRCIVCGATSKPA